MKLALLMSVLVASCLCWVKIPVSVQGTVTCSKAYKFRVALLEEDRNEEVDNIARTEFVHSEASKPASYSISGEAFDGWLEGTVEPILTIVHDCGKALDCVCYEFGDVSKKTDFKNIDVNLDTTELKWCPQCSQGYAYGWRR